MMIYPLIVAVVSLVFGVTVLGQWVRRRRPQQLVWGIALVMAVAASLAYVGFLSNGDAMLFRLYYIFGALLMAAYLGMGSLYLVLGKRTADLVLGVLVVVSAIGVALLLVAPIDAAQLHSVQHHGGPGTGVFKTGLWLIPLILHNIFGAVAVIGVALYSAYKVLRRQAPRRFAVANVTIAVGTIIITLGSSAARLGSPNYFWVFMAVGWVVIFAGFLMTTNLAALGAPGNAPATRTTAPA